jgi:hypothetical protein
MNPQQPRQLRLELPATLHATYANTVIISHTLTEIVFDFIQIMPNDPRARVESRVVMTPANAKMLLRALGENIARFEEKNGDIKLPPTPPSLADQLFGGVKANDEETPDADA